MRHSGDHSGRGWESLTIVGLALAIRGAVLLLMPGALEADPDGYRAVGENLARHGVLGHGTHPTAVRPPLYPVVLAGCALVGGTDRGILAWVHLAIGAATVWLAWDLGRQCGFRPLEAGCGAILVAADPILLQASTLVMTETLAALLATAALHAWSRWSLQPTALRAAWFGGLLGLGVLCRPEWLLGLFAGATMLLCCSARWTSWSAYLIAAGLVVLPWPIRNAVQFGRPILTTTHGGYTLLLANNPWLYQHLHHGGTLADWDPEPFHTAWGRIVEERFLLPCPTPGPVSEDTSLINQATPSPEESPRIVDELEADRWAYHEAIRTIRENPGTFGWAAVLRWARLWQLTPSRMGDMAFDRGVYYGSFLCYGGIFILAIWGIWVVYKKQTKPPCLQTTLLLALLWAGLLTAVHTFYWSEMRMRAPLTAGIALAVVSGLAGRFSKD